MVRCQETSTNLPWPSPTVACYQGARGIGACLRYLRAQVEGHRDTVLTGLTQTANSVLNLAHETVWICLICLDVHFFTYFDCMFVGQCITTFKCVGMCLCTLIRLCSSHWPEMPHWTWGMWMLEMRILSKSARWNRIFGSAQVQPLPKLCTVSQLWRRRGWVLGFQWRWRRCTSKLASEPEYSNCLQILRSLQLRDCMHYLNVASCEVFLKLMWDHCYGSGFYVQYLEPVKFPAGISIRAGEWSKEFEWGEQQPQGKSSNCSLRNFMIPFDHSSGLLGKMVDILDVYFAFNLFSLFNEE